jgi:site-specific DNA-methyltransferase (adenine-specific)
MVRRHKPYDHVVIAAQKVHLTSKPVALIRDLLAITAAGGTVLDPFLGGGSTALAALETGRRCIGVELSHEYIRIILSSLRRECTGLMSM